jgi:hypothetical protein
MKKVITANLIERIIRLEARPDLLTSTAMVRKLTSK